MIGTHLSSSPENTSTLARRLASCLQPGDVLLLSGDLGAGKTCFVQGLAEGLGCAGNVTSPTFSLIQIYEGTTPLVHADLYRLEDAAEAQRIGLQDYLEAPWICAVEWSERAQSFWPADAWRVTLESQEEAENVRILHIRRGTAA